GVCLSLPALHRQQPDDAGEQAHWCQHCRWPQALSRLCMARASSRRCLLCCQRWQGWKLAIPAPAGQLQAAPSRTAVVGDRLDTDIAMGKQGGLVTLLPLTGVTTMQGALSAASGEQPDYIIPSVAALAGLPSS
ncbi:hypothetical protein COO60DRAFT_1466609, partial [Scenedesmus sp. NREL 46B-D3]